MIYQEQFQLIFKKIKGSSSGDVYNLCSYNGGDMSRGVLASLLSNVDIDNLNFLIDDIEAFLNGDSGDFFHAFDGLDETIEFQGGLVVLGEFQYEITDFKGILAEWIKFCSD